MSMWRRAMDYLGLSGEDSFDDYDMSAEYDRPVRQREPSMPIQRPRGGYAPEFGDDASHPTARGRVDDTGSARRPDDSGVQMRPTSGARSNVRTIGLAAGEPMTVRPLQFNQAQEIADHFKGGTPVIINLEDADDVVSRRIIDFASGLCYAMSGSMEKVARGVYLLKPPAAEPYNRS
ncbi:MAG: cell division protein SepF [Actinomycetota bacterium]